MNSEYLASDAPFRWFERLSDTSAPHTIAISRYPTTEPLTSLRGSILNRLKTSGGFVSELSLQRGSENWAFAL